MRNDPADDLIDRPWAVTSGVLFAQLSVTAGTLVVNDPASLANAVNKTYFQHFPEAVRPRTLISRDPDRSRIRHGAGQWCSSQTAAGIRGERRVLRLRRRVTQPEPDDRGRRPGRLHRRSGAPPRAEQGDVRLFLMNGEPLSSMGLRAFRRVNDSLRPSIEHARRWRGRAGGGRRRDANVAEAVRPELLADGMFLVGLDIVGDKLMEVNVFSPGRVGQLREALQSQVLRTQSSDRARTQGRTPRALSRTH